MCYSIFFVFFALFTPIKHTLNLVLCPYEISPIFAAAAYPPWLRFAQHAAPRSAAVADLDGLTTRCRCLSAFRSLSTAPSTMPCPSSSMPLKTHRPSSSTAEHTFSTAPALESRLRPPLRQRRARAAPADPRHCRASRRSEPSPHAESASRLAPLSAARGTSCC